jgi:signal transduction histidine kinase
MERQVNHLVRLVDDLLEVSRITRGVIEVRKQVLDLGTIVRAAADTSRPMLDGLGHQLRVEIPEAPIPVAGDPVRLTQVFLNLLSNAAKYTNPGGFIMIEVRQDGDRAVVIVRDNGIGIEPGLLSSVFEMFTQVDRSDRRTQGGLGIGLTPGAQSGRHARRHRGGVQHRTPSRFRVRRSIADRRPTGVGAVVD